MIGSAVGVELGDGAALSDGPSDETGGTEPGDAESPPVAPGRAAIGDAGPGALPVKLVTARSTVAAIAIAPTISNGCHDRNDRRWPGIWAC